MSFDALLIHLIYGVFRGNFWNQIENSTKMGLFFIQKISLFVNIFDEHKDNVSHKNSPKKKCSFSCYVPPSFFPAYEQFGVSFSQYGSDFPNIIVMLYFCLLFIPLKML